MLILPHVGLVKYDCIVINIYFNKTCMVRKVAIVFTPNRMVEIKCATSLDQSTVGQRRVRIITMIIMMVNNSIIIAVVLSFSSRCVVFLAKSKRPLGLHIRHDQIIFLNPHC